MDANLKAKSASFNNDSKEKSRLRPASPLKRRKNGPITSIRID
jgi:hypothetical protein